MSAPIRRRPSGSPGRCSATTADPDVGRIRPSNMRSVVVFPAPFGPRNPNTSPRCTSRSSASTAVIDGPYRLVKARVVMTFPFAIGISFTNGSMPVTVGAKEWDVVTYAPDLCLRREGEQASTSRGISGGARFDQSNLVGEDHGLDAVAQFELVEDMGDVRLDGRLANLQLFGDLRVREPASQQLQHLHLAVRQGLEVGTGAPYRRALPGELLDQPFGDRGSKKRLATCRGAHATNQFLGRDVLEEETARARGQRIEDVLVEVVGREDHDLARHPGRAQTAGRLDAVEAGHSNIHQDHIRPEGADRIDRGG